MNHAYDELEATRKEILALRGERNMLALRADESASAVEISRLRLALLDGLRTIWQEATGEPLPPDIHGRFWMSMESKGTVTMNRPR